MMVFPSVIKEDVDWQSRDVKDPTAAFEYCCSFRERGRKKGLDLALVTLIRCH